MIECGDLVWAAGGRRLGGPLTAAWGPGTVVVRGSNGCGKTTLLRTLVGVLPPAAGRVRICGDDLCRHATAARAKLGWMPDRVPVPGTTLVGELLALVRWTKGLPAGLPAVAMELGVERLLGKRLVDCSLGEQRRACFAAATLGEPPVLVLDEPDRGLDAQALAVVEQHVLARAAAGNTNLVVTHSGDFAGRIATLTVGLELPAPNCG